MMMVSSSEHLTSLGKSQKKFEAIPVRPSIRLTLGMANIMDPGRYTGCGHCLLNPKDGFVSGLFRDLVHFLDLISSRSDEQLTYYYILVKKGVSGSLESRPRRLHTRADCPVEAIRTDQI